LEDDIAPQARKGKNIANKSEKIKRRLLEKLGIWPY
jgi:hypothetical protein